MPRSSDPSQDLIFGLLALQNGLIEQAQLVAAFHAWTRDKTRHMAEYLIEQGAIEGGDRAALEALASRHLQKHGGDPERSLAALPTEHSTRERLRLIAIGDLELDASLSRLGPGATLPGEDHDLTASYVFGAPTSDGQRFFKLRPLARGGLGQVSVALDREVNREVALKEILPDRADDPECRDRFSLEAEVTGRLEHPGVVPLYGLGRNAEGQPFYAMRLVNGRTMKQEIERFHQDWKDPPRQGGGHRTAARRSLELRQLLNRFIAVCHTVGYAHSRGVIHRDLKPANILLGPYGETLVVDWGLAKVVGRSELLDAPRDGAAAEATLRPATLARDSVTVVGTVVGTPAYMSPEQAEGRLDQLGPASDVYSLGATLYCLLTGRPPFDGGLDELFVKIRAGEFPHPRAIEPRVPGSLAAICLKAMAVDPRGRYATHRALADDLEHWLADEPVSVYREPISTRVTRWGRRHRTAAAAIGVLLVTAVLGLTAGTLLLGRANSLVERQRLRAEAAARTLSGQLYINRINLAQRSWEDANIRRTRELLDECRPRSPGDADLRGFEWYYLDHLFGAGYQSLQGHDGPVWSVAYSPDGSRLASGGQDGAVIVWDLARGEAGAVLRGHTAQIRAVAYSPDGSRLASVGLDRTVRIWDARAGLLLSTFTGQTFVNALAFSPDGRRLASAGNDNVVTIRDVESGRQLTTLAGPTEAIYGLDFSSDGARIACASTDRTVWIWDLATGQAVLTYRGHNGAALGVAFSADGKRVASCGDERLVKVWDARTGKDLLTLAGHTNWVRAVRYSPDGARVAAAGQDQTVRVWDARTGQLLATLRGHQDDVRAVAYSPDGFRLASAGIDSRVNVWTPDAGQGHVALKGHTDCPRGLAFSPDGTRLASASLDATVRIWDPVSRRSLATLTGHTNWVLDVAFERGGRYLASASRDGTVKLWDPSRWTLTRTLTCNPQAREFANALFCVAVSPDGSQVAAAGADRTVCVWDAATGSVLHRLPGHNGYIWGLAYSPDGSRLASSSEDRIAKVWDLATGSLSQALSGHAGCVWRVAFSPDGARIATASEDRTIRIWNLRDGKVDRVLTGQTGQVQGIAFSRDGRRLTSGGKDGAVRLWDTATGQELLALTGEHELIWCVAVSPDGARIAAGDQGHEVLIWDSGLSKSP